MENKQELYTKLDSYREDRVIDFPNIDENIINSLNPYFPLRDYQIKAFENFKYYNESYKKKETPIHLLFHMATGSGKTLLMASLILLPI